MDVEALGTFQVQKCVRSISNGFKDSKHYQKYKLSPLGYILLSNKEIQGNIGLL